MNNPLVRALLMLAVLGFAAGASLADPPTIAVEATVPATSEPAPNIRVRPGQFTLTRRGDTSGSLRVLITYRGSATPEADYRRLPNHVTFAPGETRVTLSVEAIDDDEIEEEEEVILEMPVPVDDAPYLVHREHGSATVTIHDSDRDSEFGTVSIEATRSIAEETASPLRRLSLVGELRVSRRGPLTSPLPVWIAVTGSATPGIDYEPIPMMITIPEREDSVTIPVRALYDDIPEGIETVIATISNCPPETEPPLGAPCTLFRIDPAFESATVFIREDGLSRATVHLSDPADGAFISQGTPIRLRALAMDMESYISRVEFRSGEQLISVSEIHFLVPPDPGTPIAHQIEWEDAPPGVHELTAGAEIRDPRSGIIKIQSAPIRIRVGEPAPNEPPQIVITSPAPATEFTVGEPIEIRAEGVDPDGSIRQVEFFANGSKIGEHLTALDPAVGGRPQRFLFTWERTTPGPVKLIVRATDNDRKSKDSLPVEILVHSSDERPVVGVVALDAHAQEPSNGQSPNPAVFSITRRGSTAGDLSVAYTLGGQAENGIDYERLSGTAVIPAGESSVEVRVIPVADEVSERLESVSLRLSEGIYALALSSHAHAVIYEAVLLNPDRARCLQLPDGLLHLCFPARAGRCFCIESSENMRDWVTTLCLLSVDGTIHLVREPESTERQRFWRISEDQGGIDP